MKECHLEFSDLTLRRRDIYVQLGYGDADPQEDVLAIVDAVLAEAERVCRPRIAYGYFDGKKVNGSHMEIGTVDFLCGPIIGRYFDGVERFALFVTTAGAEYDAYIHSLKDAGDIVTEYIADGIGSVIAEAAVDEVLRRIGEDIADSGMTMTNPCSPGYCGWHVREQRKLFSLLPEGICGVALNDSCLMLPVKSVSGMVGIGRGIVRMPYACDICGLTTCYKRRQTAK